MVTGGLGFIGSAFLRRMVPLHPDINWLNVDDEREGSNHESVKDVKDLPNYAYRKVPIENVDAVRNTFSIYPITDIIHLAAESDVDRSIKRPIYTVGVNIMGTLHLLEAAKSAQGFKRFVYVSTDEVYGPLRNGEKSKTEGDTQVTSSPYSASKASAEHFCHAYLKTFNLDVVTTRGSNTFGPWQDYTKFIPVAMKALREGKKIPIYGKGNQRREWLPVDLHAEGIEAVWLRGEKGNTYNIGTGIEYENIELAKILSDAVGASGAVKHVEDRPGHDFRYAINNEKLQTIGWPINTTHLSKSFVDSQIVKTAQWYYAQK